MNQTTGIYRHYKGQYYAVFSVVNCSETQDPMVIYQCLYGDYSYWVRPQKMFNETISINSKTSARFTYCANFPQNWFAFDQRSPDTIDKWMRSQSWLDDTAAI